MMPVVRIDDATTSGLKQISTWYGTTTPAETIRAIVRKEMENLGFVGEEETADGASDSYADADTNRTPGLSFTRIDAVTLAGENLGPQKWSDLLRAMVGQVKLMGITGDKLVKELRIRARASIYDKQGYKYYPELGISVQGQSAPDVWREVSRLATKFSIPVRVDFHWLDDERAQRPGQSSSISAGN